MVGVRGAADDRCAKCGKAEPAAKGCREVFWATGSPARRCPRCLQSTMADLNGKAKACPPPPLSLDDADLSTIGDELSAKLLRLVESKESAGACELADLFGRPQMKGLFAAFDCLTGINQRSCSSLPAVPYEVDDDDGLAVKIVRLLKNNEPLGATIKEQNGRLIIARILRGGVADRSGCIGSGDQVVEVNGVSVIGKQPMDVVRLLNSSLGSVTLKLIPAVEPPSPSGPVSPFPAKNEHLFLRAMFSYLPSEDFLNPCVEASLSFKRGDILQVLDSSDSNWWQAKLIGDGDALNISRIGLIPGKALLQSLRDGGAKFDHPLAGGPSCSLQQSRPVSGDGIRCYEDVVLYRPPTIMRRPIVLIGPTGVGRTELKRRLITLDSSTYRTTVPHTSRPPKADEVDGVHYHFTSRASMERLVRDGRLIEYGEYKGNLYGTTVDSVREVMEQGYVCLLNPHPQAIKQLRKAELKPYFVYVRPPPFPTLKATRAQKTPKKPGDADDLEQIIEQGKALERLFSQYFDYVLVNGSLDVAIHELTDVVRSVCNEPQWIPASWLC